MLPLARKGSYRGRCNRHSTGIVAVVERIVAVNMSGLLLLRIGIVVAVPVIVIRGAGNAESRMALDLGGSQSRRLVRRKREGRRADDCNRREDDDQRAQSVQKRGRLHGSERVDQDP